MIASPKNLSVWTVLVFIVLVAASLPAAAQEYLGAYRDWHLYKFADGDQTICYIATEPKQEEGDFTRRDDPAVLVTRRPAPRVVDEVSVTSGYEYKEASEVEVQVDRDSKVMLFTRGEHAWTKSEEADQSLIEAMKRGSNMTVRGTSIKDTWSLDTYSLLGFTAAYNAMQACFEQSETS